MIKTYYYAHCPYCKEDITFNTRFNDSKYPIGFSIAKCYYCKKIFQSLEKELINYSFEEQVTIICLSLGYKLNLFGKIKQEIYDNVKNQILNGTIVISDKKLCDSIIRTNKESYRELMKSVGLKINDLSYDIFYIDGVKVSDYLKKVSDLSSNTNKPNINDIYK